MIQIIFMGYNYYYPTYVISGVVNLYASWISRQQIKYFAHAKILKFIVFLLNALCLELSWKLRYLKVWVSTE